MGSERQRVYGRLCNEEIINGREVMEDNLTLRVPCAGQAYYHLDQAINIAKNSADKTAIYI